MLLDYLSTLRWTEVRATMALAEGRVSTRQIERLTEVKATMALAVGRVLTRQKAELII